MDQKRRTRLERPIRGCSSKGSAPGFTKPTIIDLTYPCDDDVIYWPTSPGRLGYLGDDTPGDASKLRFPSFGEGAARWLIEERAVHASAGLLTAKLEATTA